MELISKNIKTLFKDNVFVKDTEKSACQIAIILDDLYNSIPDNKRISYGRVYTVKISAKYIYDHLSTEKKFCFDFATALFDAAKDHRVKGVALGVSSFYGQKNFNAVLPFFLSAAADDHWEMREFAQMFFRKVIKAHPEEAQVFLLEQVVSTDPNIRRFVAEGIRPVIENNRFYKEPEFPLSILRHLFREKVAYPRSSVGNNLSDLAHNLPDLVFDIVEELVSYKDKNSYWIAYRACRNLVKKYPEKVMDLLGVDEYRYKRNVHKRED